MGAGLQVVIDGLAGLLGQFEPDRTAGLFLTYCGADECVAVWSDILDLEGDDITASQLAVDRQVEHRQIAAAALDLKLGADRPEMPWL